MTGFGLILWVALGIAVTQWYDRKGMYRMQPALMEYVERSARACRGDGLAGTTSDPVPPG